VKSLMSFFGSNVAAPKKNVFSRDKKTTR